jgi:hypothetical protein
MSGQRLTTSVPINSADAAWSALVAKMRFFANACFLNEASPELLSTFTRIDRCMTAFLRRVVVTAPHTRPARPLLSIEKAIHEVLEEWKSFVCQFSVAIEQNIAPLYTYLVARVSDLIPIVKGLLKCYDRPHPLLMTPAMRPTKEFIRSLELEIKRLRNRLRRSDPHDFDALSFRRELQALQGNVRILFPDVFPNNSVTLGSIIEFKRELLVAFDLGACACAGIRAFDGLVKGVTDEIFSVAGALETLFMSMGSEKHLLNRALDDHPIESNDRDAPTVAAVIENCSRIQSRLRRITALAGLVEPPIECPTELASNDHPSESNEDSSLPLEENTYETYWSLND